MDFMKKLPFKRYSYENKCTVCQELQNLPLHPIYCSGVELSVYYRIYFYNICQKEEKILQLANWTVKSLTTALQVTQEIWGRSKNSASQNQVTAVRKKINLSSLKAQRRNFNWCWGKREASREPRRKLHYPGRVAVGGGNGCPVRIQRHSFITAPSAPAAISDQFWPLNNSRGCYGHTWGSSAGLQR